VVLLGVFGGILAFGFMGLFLGPTLLAVAYSLLSDWVGSPVGSVVTSAAEPADKVLHRGDEQARNAP
jgi:predicted PurR-regulated permease PerM